MTGPWREYAALDYKTDDEQRVMVTNLFDCSWKVGSGLGTRLDNIA